MAKSLMFIGTGSGVGKSIITAAFCRYLHNIGLKVAPFKAQNMALNSAVTPLGFEIGRAQAYQAEVCGILPDVLMNPILLKPTGDYRSQVIVLGKAIGNYSAREYYENYDYYLSVVRDAYDSLSNKFDIIIMEGAGSPAEINLQKTDLVNMNMASYAQAPCILIGDIDRGGVFAWLKGTYDLIPEDNRSLIKGYLINKFRGDIKLLLPGIEIFKDYCSLKYFGTLPYLKDVLTDQEDSLSLDSIEKKYRSISQSKDRVIIGVLCLDKISNWTDLNPLLIEDDVLVKFIKKTSDFDEIHALIIPGTKNTINEMKIILNNKWDDKIRELAHKNIPILGICGGYQLLGEKISDLHGYDGLKGEIEGIGLIPIYTSMQKEKTLKQGKYSISIPFLSQKIYQLEGYEIHLGKSYIISDNRCSNEQIDANIFSYNKVLPVAGTYLHGIFENDDFRNDFLNFTRIRTGIKPRENPINYREIKNKHFDLLANWFSENTDIKSICSLIGI